MDRYRYIATIREYCDFCLELLAVHGVCWQMELEQAKQRGEDLSDWDEKFRAVINDEFLTPEHFESKYGIKYTLDDLLDILSRARIEYEQSNGDLDRYYASDAVQEFKVRFLGNQLSNRDLLDSWIAFFGFSLPKGEHRRGIYRLGPGIYNNRNSTILGIYDINYVTDIGFRADLGKYYHKYPNLLVSLSLVNYEDGFIDPTDSVRFTPAKFGFLVQTVVQIIDDDFVLARDKHKSLFKLMEFVFGEQSNKMLMWLTHQVLEHCSTRKDLKMFYSLCEYEWTSDILSELEERKEDHPFWEEFEALEVVGDVYFTPEVKESLKIYRAEKENAK